MEFCLDYVWCCRKKFVELMMFCSFALGNEGAYPSVFSEGDLSSPLCRKISSLFYGKIFFLT